MDNHPKTTSVLIVDDVPGNIRVLADCLRGEHTIHVATRGVDALERAARLLPDIILLDVVMPDMDGYAVCRQLKASPATADIPVIFVTACFSPEDEAQGLSLGAVDYVVKPASPSVVRARVKNHLELRAAREELARQNAALLEAAKLREDVDHILRHDLKAPLNGIISLPQIILEEGNLSDGQAMLLKLIEENGYKMLSMINHSLDLFKLERGVYVLCPEPVELLTLLRRLMTEFASLIGPKKLSLRLTVNGVEPDAQATVEVSGERLLLYSMLANCLKNALEASPDDGTVEIAVRTGEATVIAITNHGAVPTGVRTTFFKKFTTEGKSGGTGLGAYSAKLIAGAHGGFIRMETSDETDTTTVSIALPRRPGTPLADV